MRSKKRLLALLMVFVFAAAFLVPGYNGQAMAAAAAAVSTQAADVDGDVVTLKAKVTQLKSSDEIESFGFYWGEDKDDVGDGEEGIVTPEEVGDDSDGLEKNDTFKFEIDADDLDEDTTYYFMAYIVVDGEEYTGRVLSFTISEVDVPEVTTNSATSIKADGATLNGTIKSFGGDDEITEYGFYYGTSSSPNTKKKVGGTSDYIDEGEDFDYKLSGLKADTKYYFKAYARNSEGTAYGQVKSFTTKKDEGDTKPGETVTKSSVFTIDQLYYTLNGTYQVMDAAPYIKNSRTYMPIRYVGYAMGLTDAQIQWYEATRTVILTKGNNTVVLVIGSPAMFVNGQVRMMDVAPEITNSRTCLPIAWVASAFGTTAIWNPALRTVTIAATTEPGKTGQADVTTNSATSVGSDYATLNGKVGSSGLVISEYGFYYGTRKADVTDGRDGDADKVRASGTKDSFSKKVTNLDEDTTYYFMAYAIDSNDNISYGTVKSFSTKASDADKPSVTTNNATGIGTKGAVLNGKVTSSGDDDITEYGFYYGTTSSPSKKVKVGSDDIDAGDSFDYDLGGLKANTTYYFKAYAKNSEGTAYGAVKKFTTKK